ncbi:MAG: hypothetical protein ACREM3_21095 [Candidatus Rokuibacteriota bacterium]
MGRIVAIIGAVALLVGLGAGYLWWGRPLDGAQRAADDAKARVEALERDAAAAKTATARPDEVTGLRARVEALEAELERERQMRLRLESVVSQGKK